MLIDLISNREMMAMDNWREDYGLIEDSTPNYHYPANMSVILREWERSKSEHLAKLFGNQLILEKEFSYKRPFCDIEQDICDYLIDGYKTLGRENRTGREFFEAYHKFINAKYDEFAAATENCCGLYRLVTSNCLTSNIFDGKTFYLPLEDGKKLKVEKGCKVSKTLGKIAKHFNLPGYEDFRICLSYILNQKELTGTVHLSIHPLDYMTMSDNTYDWDSCMSWVSHGSYRQGTIEMMNSKTVVVAYLTGEDEMDMGRSPEWTPNNRDYLKWNSKRWRQLFVVDKKAIASVKSYPWAHSELSQLIVEWLKELAEERLGWTYGDITDKGIGERHYIESFPEEKNGFSLTFINGCMYNDFGSTTHYICLSDDIKADDIKGSNDPECDWVKPWLEIPYSGKSQCIICGCLDPELDSEICLACNDCQEIRRCDHCGEYICGETYEIDGLTLCEHCWDHKVINCEVCDEEHFEEYTRKIYFIPRLTPEQIEESRKYHKDNISWMGYNFSSDDINTCEFSVYRSYYSVTICESDACLKKWVETNLKEGEVPHYRAWTMREGIAVYVDQMKEEYLDRLWCAEDIDCFEPYRTEASEVRNPLWFKWWLERFNQSKKTN